jgi:hypothetical protein
MSHGENHSSIIRQEKKRNALNNAGERELNVDDERIELTTSFILRIHDATRNRLLATMSRRTVQGNFVSLFRLTSCAACASFDLMGRKKIAITAS